MAEVVRVVLPSYGTVIGFSDREVQRFLGIPYASVTKRWTKPSRALLFPGGKHDGTRHGPMCPQPLGPASITQISVPGYPANPDAAQDEFSCLNLNITRPSQTQDKLPVMIWIHGGAFSVGSNSESVYDGVEFVTRSKKIGLPVIHVAINYRLGFFGFLASRDLLGEANNESVGNYGLWDQSMAIDFVREIIGEFGGDSGKITIFGESAGAASVHSQLLHGKQSFQRAICQSGVIGCLGPLPLESPFIQGVNDTLQAQLQAKSLHELRSATPAQLVQAMQKIYPDLPASFIVDDSNLAQGFFPPKTAWDSVPEFCKALLLGSCTNEAIIMARSLISTGPERLGQCLRASGLSEATLKSYNLDDVETKDYGGVVPALIDFQTDLAFKGPIEFVKAAANPDSLFIYRFERENKWGPGPFSGHAHHTIDLLYLAGVPLHFPTSEAEVDVEIAMKMIDAWVDFGNGGQPWTSYSQNQSELIIGRDGSFNIDTDCVKSEKSNLSNMKKEISANPAAVVRLNAVLSNGAVRA